MARPTLYRSSPGKELVDIFLDMPIILRFTRFVLGSLVRHCALLLIKISVDACVFALLRAREVGCLIH